MAILDAPIFGTGARGRIKGTVVFFERVANVNYTDPGPGSWFQYFRMSGVRQSHGAAREAWKNKYRDGVEAWYELTQEERDAYKAEASGMLTGFNVFMSEYLLS